MRGRAPHLLGLQGWFSLQAEAVSPSALVCPLSEWSGPTGKGQQTGRVTRAGPEAAAGQLREKEGQGQQDPRAGGGARHLPGGVRRAAGSVLTTAFTGGTGPALCLPRVPFALSDPGRSCSPVAMGDSGG